VSFWYTLPPIFLREDSRHQPLLRPRPVRLDPSPDTLTPATPMGPLGDPVSGLRGGDPVIWAQSLLHFSPDEVQSAILRSAARRLILCCTRQFGKSTVTAIKALQHAWTNPGSLVLVAAPTARQSGEWLAKTREFLARLNVRTRSDGHNRLSLVLPNRSRLVGLPGVAQNIRGFSSASLVIIDEAAFVPDELFHALNPMLAVSGGSLWLVSTPFTQSGFFYEEWSRSPNPPEAPVDRSSDEDSLEIVHWDRYRVTALDCPRIAPQFLAEQRVLLGDLAFRREYLCEFVAPGIQVFDRELLDSAFDPALQPYNGGVALWR
jgi:hypothetical protein